MVAANDMFLMAFWLVPVLALGRSLQSAAGLTSSLAVLTDLYAGPAAAVADQLPACVQDVHGHASCVLGCQVYRHAARVC